MIQCIYGFPCNCYVILNNFQNIYTDTPELTLPLKSCQTQKQLNSIASQANSMCVSRRKNYGTVVTLYESRVLLDYKLFTSKDYKNYWLNLIWMSKYLGKKTKSVESDKGENRNFHPKKFRHYVKQV